MINGNPTKRAEKRAADRQREKEVEEAVSWLRKHPGQGPAAAIGTGQFPTFTTPKQLKSVLERRTVTQHGWRLMPPGFQPRQVAALGDGSSLAGLSACENGLSFLVEPTQVRVFECMADGG